MPEQTEGATMETGARTSLEQLDSLLTAGRITQTDYDMLREALIAAPPQPPVSTAIGTGRRRLAKSWTNRQLGGVCGGLADYFGLNANGLRAAFVIGALVSCGTAVFIYFALYFILPWSGRPSDAVKTPDKRGHTGFAVVMLLFAALLGAIHVVLFGRTREIFDRLGAEIPGFWRMGYKLTRFLLETPTGLTVLAVVFAALVGIRIALPSSPRGSRRFYDLAVFLTLAALLLFLAASAYLPLFQLSRVIG
jgi:phage shock protein PspC (stress-responsive transcriptional regulator)